MSGPDTALNRADLADDPLAQFDTWFADARAAVSMPEAAALATADGRGRPSARMVLVKEWSADGFVFYTNYESRKGRDLAENPFAALVFYWDPLGRQVRIEGPVARVSAEASDDYFASRPRGAQISASISEQSEPVESREVLEKRVQHRTREGDGADVARPGYWGGYVLSPEAIEFWQNRPDRLHDRFRFTREGAHWRVERLQP